MISILDDRYWCSKIKSTLNFKTIKGAFCENDTTIRAVRDCDKI